MIENLDLLRPFLTSLAIGFAIGIERERSHPEGVQALGIRSFALIALMGTLVAWLDRPVVTFTLTLFTSALIVFSYLRTTSSQKRSTELIDLGTTTEISAMLVYILGYICLEHTLWSAMLGLGVLLILLGRERLHRFSRQGFTPQEIEAAVILLVFFIGIIPLLPPEPIDPLGLINLRQLGYLMALIASIQFGGYVAIRLLGEKMGLSITGFLGGFVSSTAVFLHLPRRLKSEPELLRPITSALILSNVGNLFELLIILFAASITIGKILAIPLSVAMLVGAITAFFLEKNIRIKNSKASEYSKNPLDLKSIALLSLFIFSMVLIIGFARITLGSHAASLVAFLGGLFELHSVSLATATLFSKGKLSLDETILNLSLALLGSFVSKTAIAWSYGIRWLSLRATLTLFAMFFVGVIAFLLENFILS